MNTEIPQFIQLIFQFLLFIISIYNFVFFIWILSTWLPVNRSIIILRFVDNLIDPVYHTLLRILPPLRFGIMDFSPFYMFIFLMLVETGVELLYRLVLSLFIK
ncbi:MAG: YggT family protein [Brevinema sp.]